MRALIAVLLLLSSSAFADTKNFAWDYPAGTTATGFKIFCGTATGVYSPTPVATIPIATKTATVTFPPSTTRFCAVAAYDSLGQSPYSNEVTFYSNPDAPTNLRITLKMVTDPVTGTTIWVITEIVALW